ncbi:MAG TPA: glycosyltransferase [Gemmatimonadaceae bacterium]|nr:glycosyltransferase [Gemmatimonadaceae bacterium]
MTAAARDPNAAPVLFVHWGEEGIRGSERVLLDLLAKLDRDAFAPLVWCNAETMANAVRQLDVPVHLSRMPILLGWDAPRLDLAGYRALVRQGTELIRSHGARVVHANSGAPNQWMVAAARGARIPLVGHLHAVYKFRERCTLLLHQVPLVVGCSDAVVAPFRADGVPASRLRVIHNGVDPERLHAGDARTLRAALCIPDGHVVVASAGALVPLKGFDLLLHALSLLRDRGLSAHAAIIGEGPNRGALEALARELGVSDRAHFLGHQKDVGAILRDAADIVVVASRVESFGLVAAEAGAVGRATVATRVGGLAEVVEDEKTGLLVPPGDPVALAAALARLIESVELRDRLASAARERVLANFTTERAARAFEGLYRELMARPAHAFGWSKLGFRVAPFARLGAGVVGRRMGMRIADA